MCGSSTYMQRESRPTEATCRPPSKEISRSGLAMLWWTSWPRRRLPWAPLQRRRSQPENWMFPTEWPSTVLWPNCSGYGSPLTRRHTGQKLPRHSKSACHMIWNGFLFSTNGAAGNGLKIFKTRATSAKSTCSGLSQSAVKSVKAVQSHGHQLMVCNYLQSPGSFLFCNRCGCYSQICVIGLGRTCVGRAGSQLHRLHRHIHSGKHPTTGALLGKPRFLPSGAFGHATGNRPSQLEEVPSQVRGRPAVLQLTQIPKVAVYLWDLG